MAYDQNSKFGELTRNLQENQLGGVIFGCNHDTIDECFRKQLFGSPSAHYSYVKNVKVGMPLFLFNYSDRKLHGIFEAASPGQMYVDPNAWIGEGSSGTAFPAQVCIVTRTQYPPLLESQFKTLLGDNYYDHHHFYFELDHAQTRALISLFKSLAPANFNQVPAVSSIRNPSVSSSPTKMKLTAVPDPKKVTANSEETNPLCVLSDRAAPFIWADDVDSASNTDEKKSEEPVARKSWWGNLDPSTVPSWLKSNWGEVERQKYFARKDDKKDISEEEDYEFEYSYGLSFPRMQENDKLSLTLPEKNIDIWRQLWRVLERSDLLVMVVDARDPLFYRCPDLEAYAKEIDEHKRTMLLVNKADLLPLNIRKRWAEYFKAQDILYVFWSAKAAAATLESKKLSGYSEEETASLDLDTKVYGRDELLMRLQAEAESIVAQRKTSTAKEHHDVSSSHSVSSVTKHVVVGFVGYPNVGKSSTINALFGERTGVTHTPGKIKLTLYDYPGTILPCFSISRNELSQEEIQIDQLAIIDLCKKVAKGLDVVQVSRTKNKLALVSTDVIYRLKSLAEDIRIWMQWSSAFDMQILYNLYISIGKKIVQNNNKQAKITERPKEMICDLERLASELYTRKRLFMNMNGQMVRVFHRESLARTMDGHQSIIDILKLLFDELGQSDPRLSLIVCGQLEIPIWDYKYHLDTTLRSAMKSFKSADVPAQNGVWFRPPDTTKIFETIDKVADSLPRPRKPAATIVNSDSASSAKKFLQIVSDTRQQSALKFVREVNPLFKGVKDLISEALDPKCIGCFERNGYYFTTCCEIILCRSYAEKNTAFICKEVHKLGVNLHFPIILSKPVGK